MCPHERELLCAIRAQSSRFMFPFQPRQGKGEYSISGGRGGNTHTWHSYLQTKKKKEKEKRKEIDNEVTQKVR